MLKSFEDAFFRVGLVVTFAAFLVSEPGRYLAEDPNISHNWSWQGGLPMVAAAVLLTTLITYALRRERRSLYFGATITAAHLYLFEEGLRYSGYEILNLSFVGSLIFWLLGLGILVHECARAWSALTSADSKLE